MVDRCYTCSWRSC